MLRRFSTLPNLLNKNLQPKYIPSTPILPEIENEIYKYKIMNDYNHIPSIINGKIHYEGEYREVLSPYDNEYFSSKFHYTPEKLLKKASYRHKKAKEHWNNIKFEDRMEIFLKAADKIEHKYYNQLIATTILGQNKTPFEAELDTICELADFLRFNVEYIYQMLNKQPISPEGYKMFHNIYH